MTAATSMTTLISITAIPARKRATNFGIPKRLMLNDRYNPKMFMNINTPIVTADEPQAHFHYLIIIVKEIKNSITM